MAEAQTKILFIGTAEGLVELAQSGLHHDGFKVTAWLNCKHAYEVSRVGPNAYYPQFAAVITEMNLESLGMGEKGGLNVPGAIKSGASSAPVLLFGADHLDDVTLDEQKKFAAILTRGSLPATLRSDIRNAVLGG